MNKSISQISVLMTASFIESLGEASWCCLGIIPESDEGMCGSGLVGGQRARKEFSCMPICGIKNGLIFKI